MHKTFRLLAVAGLLCVAAAAVAGCSLTSVSGGEGSKNVDVTMGGHVTTDTTLDFKAVGYANGQHAPGHRQFAMLKSLGSHRPPEKSPL